MGQLSELANYVRRMQRRREYLNSLFDMNERLVRKYLKHGMIPSYIGGAKVKIHRDKERYLYIHIPKEIISNCLGEKACVYAIEAGGKLVYREYNPDARDCRPHVPESFGQNREEIEVIIRKVSTIDFLKNADLAGLPFGTKYTEKGRLHIVIDSRSIPVEVTKIEYEGGGGQGERAYLYLKLKDYYRNEKTIKVTHNGFDIPQVYLVPEKRIVEATYHKMDGNLAIAYTTHQIIRTDYIHIEQGRGPTLEDVERFRSRLKEQGAKSELIDSLTERYCDVSELTDQEAEHADLRSGIKERYGEWQYAKLNLAKIEAFQKEYGKRTIDFVEADRLVEVKYWADSSFEVGFRTRTQDYVDQMKSYKEAMDAWGKERVSLVFVRPIGDNLYKQQIPVFLGSLRKQVGDISWLRIINGYKLEIENS